jgi:tetratricopeptide (TPR) repeat protein
MGFGIYGFISALFLFASVAATPAAAINSSRPGQKDNENKYVTTTLSELRSDSVVEHEIKGLDVHFYPIKLEKNQFLHVIGEQRGANIVLRVYGELPQHTLLAQVDNAAGTSGAEDIYWVAEEAGQYAVGVAAVNDNAPLGKYRLIVKELRAATNQDIAHVAAQSIFQEAEELTAKREKESLQAALSKYQASLSRWREAGDINGEANALAGIGSVHFLLSNYRDALENYLAALPLFEKDGNNLRAADALTHIAQFYNLLGDGKKFIESLNSALPLWRAGGDRLGEAVTLTGLGVYYKSIGNYKMAAGYFNQALPILKELGEAKSQINILNNLGLIQVSSGDYQSAIDAFRQAMAISHSSNYLLGEAVALNNIGDAYAICSDLKTALNYFEQALRLYRKLGSRDGEATSLLYIGYNYLFSSDYEKALDLFNQALSIYIAANVPAGEQNAYCKIGQTYYLIGNANKAIENYDKALAISRKLESPESEANTLLFKCPALTQIADYAKAIECANAATAIYNTIGNQHSLGKTLYFRAIAKSKQGDLDGALADIEKSIKVIESLRVNFTNQDLRAGFFANNQEIYKFYISLLMTLHQQHRSQGYDARALQISESARARVLLELLAESGANIRNGVDANLVDQEKDLQSQLDAKAERLIQMKIKKAPASKIEAAEREIAELTATYQDIETAIRTKNPNYAALTQPQPPTLKMLQNALLDNDTILLEYSLSDIDSYLWLVSSDSITSFKLPGQAEIDELVLQAYKHFSRRDSHQRIFAHNQQTKPANG